MSTKCNKRIKNLEALVHDLTKKYEFDDESFLADSLIELRKGLGARVKINEAVALKEAAVEKLDNEVGENPVNNVFVFGNGAAGDTINVGEANAFTRKLIDMDALPPEIKSLSDKANTFFSSLIKELPNDVENRSSKSQIAGLRSTLRRENPAYSLLLDMQGSFTNGRVSFDNKDVPLDESVNEHIALAVVIGAMRSFNDNYGALTSNRDAKSIRKVLGLSDDARVTAEMVTTVGRGGMLADTLADSMGAEIVSLLGLRNKESTSVEEYNALVSGFGTLGMQLISSDTLPILKDFKDVGRLNEVKKLNSSKADPDEYVKKVSSVIDGSETLKRLDLSNSEEAESLSYFNRFAYLRDNLRYVSDLDKSVKISNRIKTVEASIESFLGDETKRVNKPTFVKPKEKKTVSLDRVDYSTANELQVATVNRLNSTPYEFNKGMSILEALYRDGDGNRNWKAIALRLGHSGNFNDGTKESLEVEEAQKLMSKDQRESIKGKDDNILRDITHLFAFRGEANTVKEEGKVPNFYFNWSVSSNDRTRINSNHMNPQNDKELARWLATPVSTSYDVVPESLKQVLDKEFITASEFASEDMSNKIFIYALAQAFEGTLTDSGIKVPDPEAAHYTDVVKGVKALLESDTTKLMESVKKGGGHLGQQLVGLAAIHEYQLGKPFSTSAMFESDGKTNGLGHKSFQMPNEDYATYLARVGVRLDDSDYAVNKEVDGSLADVVSVKGEVGKKRESDSYQEIVAVFHDKLKETIKSLKTDNPFTAGKNNPLSKLVEAELIIPISDKELQQSMEEVGKDHRNFAKPSTLEGMYGAAVETLIANRTKDIVTKLVNSITKNGYDSKGEWTSPYNLTEKDVEALINKQTVYETSFETGEVTIYSVEDVEASAREGKLSVKDLVSISRDKGSDDYSVSNAISNLESHLQFTINDAMQISMKQFFGEQLDVHKVVNKHMGNMFAVFTKVMNDFKTSNGELSKEEERILIEKIIDVFPSMRRKGSIFDDEKVLYSRKGGAKGQSVKSVKGKYVPSDVTRNSNFASLVGDLVVKVFKKDWKSPGAGTLPIGTHHLDNNNISAALVDAEEAFLMIFDAAPLSGKNGGSIYDLNKHFFEGNLKYSMLDELVYANEKLVEFVSKEYSEEVAKDILENSMGAREAAKDVDKQEGYNKSLVNLQIVAAKAKERRKKIYKSPMSVGQFAGFPGTMYEYDPKSMMKQLKEEIKGALEVLKKDSTLAAVAKSNPKLGQDLRKAVSTLESSGKSTDARKLVNIVKTMDKLVEVPEGTTLRELRKGYGQAAVDTLEAVNGLVLIDDVLDVPNTVLVTEDVKESGSKFEQLSLFAPLDSTDAKQAGIIAKENCKGIK